MCKISVVTSIYNGEKYIGETIESIINQTFKEWEYIIIDNASTDESVKIIESYAKKDSRIRFYRNEENLGIPANLNKGFGLATGKYVARTDADDLSYPTRLEKQYQYMEEHSDIALIGCLADILKGNTHTQPTGIVIASTPKETRLLLPFWNYITASSVFVRMDTIKKRNIQFKPYQYAQDFCFLLDILRVGEIALLPECLVSYRISDGQLTRVLPSALQERERIDIQMEYLSEMPTECRDIFKLAMLGQLCSVSDTEKFDRAVRLYANSCGLYQDGVNCFRQIYRAIYAWQTGSLGLLWGYVKSPFCKKNWLFTKEGISLLKQCILGEDYYGLKVITKEIGKIAGD